MDGAIKRRDLGFLLLALVCLNAAVYGNSLRFTFTNWDDETVVVRNALVQDLSWPKVQRIFTASYAANYTPLHLLSYALDYRLWGLNPAGYHLVNVALHALGACLLFLLIRRITASVPVALAVTLLFSVHPVQSETVSWVTERKNVLFSLLLFASFLAYLWRGLGWRLLSAFLFAAALLSKPAAIVFPALLFAYEWCYARTSFWRSLLRCAPFVALAALSVPLTLHAQAGGGIVAYYGGSFWKTQFTIWPVFMRYFGNLLWPVNLSPVYDVPIRASLFDLPVLLSALFLAAALALTVVLFLRRRPAAFWLVWYFAAMAPVAQLIPINALKADRYLYFAAIGLFGLAATLVAGAWERVRGAGAAAAPRRQGWLLCVLLALAVPLGILAARQNLIWKDSLTLWQHALRIAPLNPDTHHHLASAYLSLHDLDKAAAEYRRALELDPEYTKSYINLGCVYMDRQDYPEAIRLFDLARQHGATVMELDYDLALCYYNLCDYPNAEACVRQALAKDQYYAPAHVLLGNIALFCGQPDTAILYYRNALFITPGLPEAVEDLKEAERVLKERSAK